MMTIAQLTEAVIGACDDPKLKMNLRKKSDAVALAIELQLLERAGIDTREDDSLLLIQELKDIDSGVFLSSLTFTLDSFLGIPESKGYLPPLPPVHVREYVDDPRWPDFEQLEKRLAEKSPRQAKPLERVQEGLSISQLIDHADPDEMFLQKYLRPLPDTTYHAAAGDMKTKLMRAYALQTQSNIDVSELVAEREKRLAEIMKESAKFQREVSRMGTNDKWPGKNLGDAEAAEDIRRLQKQMRDMVATQIPGRGRE